MTSRDFLRVVLRRWYVMLAGALLSLGVLVVFAHNHRPLYWTEFEMVVLPPVERLNANNLKDPTYDLTSMASLLVVEANDGIQPQQTATTTLLVGEGIHRGTSVRLHNYGSQWQTYFTRPVIDVQVVDASPDVVRTRAAALQGRLTRLLRDRQQTMGVLPASRMTITSSPRTPVVTESIRSLSRAALAIALLGAGTTSAVVVYLDRFLLRRRRASPADAQESRSGAATKARSAAMLDA